MGKKKHEEHHEEKGAIMSTRELRGDLSEAIMRTAFGGEHIIVTHHGRRYAALVSIDDLKLIQTVKENRNGTAK